MLSFKRVAMIIVCLFTPVETVTKIVVVRISFYKEMSAATLLLLNYYIIIIIIT